jgi:hypothetical protein
MSGGARRGQRSQVPTQLERPAEQCAGGPELAKGDEPADLARGDNDTCRSLGEADSNGTNAKVRSEACGQSQVARSTSPEAEVGPDDDKPRRQLAGEGLGEKGLGCLLGPRAVEAKNLDARDAGDPGEELKLVVEACEQARSAGGAQQRTRVGVKGNDHELEAGFRGKASSRFEQMAVAKVDSVKGAHCHSNRLHDALAVSTSAFPPSTTRAFRRLRSRAS